MLILKKSSKTIIDLKFKGISINQVHEFKYLGYEITLDSRSKTEIIKQIALAKIPSERCLHYLRITVLAGKQSHVCQGAMCGYVVVWSTCVTGSES